MGLKGNVFIEIRDREGNLIDTREEKNLFLDNGLNQLRNCLGYPDELYSTAYTPNYIAVGTGGTNPAADDDALEVEVFRKEITLKTPADKKITFQLFLDVDEANGYTLTEAGIFSTYTNDDIWARVIYSGINKTTAISVTYNWEINLGAS